MSMIQQTGQYYARLTGYCSKYLTNNSRTACCSRPLTSMVYSFVIYTCLSVHPWTQRNVTTCCLPLTIDSCYSDIVGEELIGQCQSEVRAAAVSFIHWVSRCHCWFILNLIVNGSIRVEWGEPVQFNSTPSWCSCHGQHAWWGGGCGNSSVDGAKIHFERCRRTWTEHM